MGQQPKLKLKGIIMTKEISLSLLLKVLKSAWWKILIVTVVIALAVAAFTEFVIPKKYQSSIEFYILNTSTTSEYMTTSLLASAEYLASDYIKIINSDQIVGIIIDKLEAEGYQGVTPQKVRSMISSTKASDASTFTITVTSTNADVAYIMANAITEEAPGIIRSITRPSYSSNYYHKVKDPATGEEIFEKIDESDLECVVPVRAPQLAATHSSPNVVTYTLIAALLAAFATYVLFLLLKLSDTTIRSESNFKELVGTSVTIIGTIPYWSANAVEKND